MEKDNYNYNSTLDLLKCIATILIIGSHCLPIFNNRYLDFFYGQYFFRFCVPIFFLSSGYFFNKMNKENKLKYLKRIAILYILSTVIYFPLIIYESNTVYNIIYYLIFGYSHLWYLSSLLYGLLLFYFLNKYKLFNNLYIVIILLLFSAFFGEYYLLLNSKILIFFNKLISYIGTTRNALFFCYPLLVIGSKININSKQKIFNSYALLILFTIISFLECFFLFYMLGDKLHLDVTLFNLIPPIIMFVISLKICIKIKKKTAIKIRKICDYTYIIHIYIIFLVSNMLNIKFFNAFVISTILSFLISYLIVTIINIIKSIKNKCHSIT